MEGKIPVSTNIDKLIQRLNVKDKRIADALGRGLVIGLRFFEGMIARTQMSGRPGLKTPTGNLKRSGKVSWQGFGRDIVGKVGWYAKYAMIHQKGGTITPNKKKWLHFKSGSNWVKTKSVTIPKRLHVFEQFENRGERIIFRSMQEELAKAVK